MLLYMKLNCINGKLIFFISRQLQNYEEMLEMQSRFFRKLKDQESKNTPSQSNSSKNSLSPNAHLYSWGDAQPSYQQQPAMKRPMESSQSRAPMPRAPMQQRAPAPSQGRAAMKGPMDQSFQMNSWDTSYSRSQRSPPVASRTVEDDSRRVSNDNPYAIYEADLQKALDRPAE